MSGSTGAAFLLQDLKPSKLVGSLISGTQKDGEGWVLLTFFQEPGMLVLARTSDRTSLTMSRPIALALISLLQVLVAQVHHLRSGSPPSVRRSHAAAAAAIDSRADRDEVVVSWPDELSEASCAEVDGQMELRLSERFAESLAFAVVDELGRFAARP